MLQTRRLRKITPCTLFYVLSEWQPGSPYAAANRGSAPALTVEESLPVAFLIGTFGRKPAGYTFYSHED